MNSSAARWNTPTVVADVQAYDYDTRLSLARALKDEGRSVEDLAGMLAQAEAGEPVDHPVLGRELAPPTFSSPC